MPLEWRFSKGDLERSIKAAAVLYSQDKQLEGMRFATYP